MSKSQQDKLNRELSDLQFQIEMSEHIIKKNNQKIHRFETKWGTLSFDGNEPTGKCLDYISTLKTQLSKIKGEIKSERQKRFQDLESQYQQIAEEHNAQVENIRLQISRFNKQKSFWKNVCYGFQIAAFVLFCASLFFITF